MLEVSVQDDQITFGEAFALSFQRTLRIPDEYGIDTWDPENSGTLFVHIVNSLMYREITGEEPPPTPISAKTYTERGYPWFDLYDEHLGDIAAPDVLQQVQSVGQIEQGKGVTPAEAEPSLEIPEDQVVKYKVDS